MIERIVAYEPQFDQKAYESLEVKDKERLDAYTKKQLETHLGERFNVLFSETRYEIRSGEIYGENTIEPFMQILQRGAEYRKKNGKPSDFEREEAEVIGFSKIEKTLTADDTKIGTMMLSISPPGEADSVYKHNFYDVFTLKNDQKGKYIEAIRYSSSLEVDEYVEKLKPIKEYDEKPKDSDFLREPVVVDTKMFQTADGLHAYLHKNHEYITREEFDQVLFIVTPLITSYINTMSDKPFDQNLQRLTYNAILNKADIALDLGRDKEKFLTDYIIQSNFSVNTDVFSLGKQPVRVVSTGCGASGGFSISQNLNQTASPFSVSEFGLKNKNEQEWFSCPKCKYKANGPVGDVCPGCRITKEEFAKEGGQACD